MQLKGMKFKATKLKLVEIILEEGRTSGDPLSQIMLALMKRHNAPEVRPTTLGAQISAIVLASLKRNNGSITQTARELSVSRVTINAWIQRWKKGKLHKHFNVKNLLEEAHDGTL